MSSLFCLANTSIGTDRGFSATYIQGATASFHGNQAIASDNCWCWLDQAHSEMPGHGKRLINHLSTLQYRYIAPMMK